MKHVRKRDLGPVVAEAAVQAKIDLLRLRYRAAQLRSDRLRREARTAASHSDDVWRRAVDLYAGSLATVRVTESAYRKATEKREEDAK